MKVKLLSVLMIGILSSCYANVPINQIPKDNKAEIKTDNKQEVKPIISTSPIVIVNTSIPTPIVTKAPIEENDNTKLSSNNINTPQSSPTPIPEPSNYGIPCTPVDFSSLPKNNLDEVYNPENHKENILTILKLRGEIPIYLGFKNKYKIRQLSLLTNKKEDKFTFVSQACFDISKLNQIIKNSSITGIYDRLYGRTIEDVINSESTLPLGEETLSLLSRYTLVIKEEPTEEGFNNVNNLLLKLREIEPLKYIAPEQMGS